MKTAMIGIVFGLLLMACGPVSLAWLLIGGGVFAGLLWLSERADERITRYRHGWWISLLALGLGVGFVLVRLQDPLDHGYLRYAPERTTAEQDDANVAACLTGHEDDEITDEKIDRLHACLTDRGYRFHWTPEGRRLSVHHGAWAPGGAGVGRNT